MCAYTCWSVHTPIPLLCQLRGPRSGDTPAAMSPPGPRSRFLTLGSNKGNQSYSEKQLTPGLGQKIYKMIPGYL